MCWNILARLKHPKALPSVSSRWEWECRVMWQFVDYVDSQVTFIVFSKMVPHAYESTNLIYITFHLWICVWNVWFGWGMLVLWNEIIYKCILYLYNFLNILNLLWDVSHFVSVCLVFVLTKYHLYLEGYDDDATLRDLGLHFISLLTRLWTRALQGFFFNHVCVSIYIILCLFIYINKNNNF